MNFQVDSMPLVELNFVVVGTMVEVNLGVAVMEEENFQETVVWEAEVKRPVVLIRVAAANSLGVVMQVVVEANLPVGKMMMAEVKQPEMEEEVNAVVDLMKVEG